MEPPLSPASSAAPAPGSRAIVWSRAVQALIACIVWASIAIQVVLILTGGSDANSGDDGVGESLVTRLIRLASYFTIQSNVIVGAVATLLVAGPLRDGRLWRVARLDSLLGITVTGVVYATILAPGLDLQGWPLILTICLHYITPVLAVAAWLVFGPRPRWTAHTVAWSFAWPVAWLVWTFVHGAATGWYPYPFLDATVLGTGQAMTNASLVLVAGGLLAGVLWAIDRWVPSLIPGDTSDPSRAS